jgi:glycosyltransferase involved in cell wall biosynthesis
MSQLLVTHASAENYGSDRTVLATVTHLVASGHDVRVLLTSDGPLAGQLRDAGASVMTGVGVVLRRGQLRANPLAEIARLVRDSTALLFRRRELVADADLVVCHCLPNLTGWLLTLFTRRRLAWCTHELLTSEKERGVFKRFLTRANLVTANSEASRESMPALPDMRVVYSGAKPWASREPTVEPRVALVGRINPWKGHELAIRAIAALDERGVRVHLDIVGSAAPGSQQLAIELGRLADDLAVADLVLFHGFVPAPVDVAGKAWAVLVPSAQPEPFGRVVIEAMGAGLVVIAAGQGGPAEVIRDREDGILFAPGSAGALADSIELVVADRDLAAKLGSAAIERAKDFPPDALGRYLDCRLRDAVTGQREAAAWK